MKASPSNWKSKLSGVVDQLDPEAKTWFKKRGRLWWWRLLSNEQLKPPMQWTAYDYEFSQRRREHTNPVLPFLALSDNQLTAALTRHGFYADLTAFASDLVDPVRRLEILEDPNATPGYREMVEALDGMGVEQESDLPEAYVRLDLYVNLNANNSTLCRIIKRLILFERAERGISPPKKHQGNKHRTKGRPNWRNLELLDRHDFGENLNGGERSRASALRRP